MELGDDYVEEVTGGNGDDEITSSEHEGGNLPRKNPFIQYCQEQTKMATKFLQKNKVELTEELRKRMTKIVAKDWKALPMKKRKQSAAQKWYSEDLIIPLLTDNVQPEKWEHQQNHNKIVKNLYVDSDKAHLLITMGNSRSNAVCQLDEEACSESVSMISVRGPKAEVNLAINVMRDEETRLILAIAIRNRDKVKEKRYTAGQVDIRIKRELIADRLKQGKKPKEIMKELECGEKLVYKVKKMVMNGESLAPKTSPGRPRKVTAEFLSTMCSTYGADPFHSYAKTAEENGVCRSTVGKAVRELGMKSYIRRVRCLISTTAREKRVERCEDLIEWYEEYGKSTVTIFSDKKLWTVDPSRNRQNQRCVARSPAEVIPFYKTKNATNIMMLGVVGSDGQKMPPYFFEKKSGGGGINQEVYIKALEDAVLPWIKATYEDKNICYVFQQVNYPLLYKYEYW